MSLCGNLQTMSMELLQALLPPGGGKHGGSPEVFKSEQFPLDADVGFLHLKSTVWIIVRAPVRRRPSDMFLSKLMPHANPIAVF